MTRARDTADGIARAVTDGIIVNGDINTSANIAQSKIGDLLTNAQGGTYTLVISDRGKNVEMSGGGTLTIPLDSSVSFPIGTSILITQTGASQVTVAGAVGVTVNSSNGLKLYGQWSSALLIKRATDTWLLSGDTTA
jgi:hypothetical protein